jgi:hypothetical protein
MIVELMKYDEIVQILAPCGLNCEKCVAYSNGSIRHHASQLKELLGNFSSYAERYSNFYPPFQHYERFNVLLEHLSEGNCKGCREGHCLYSQCKVANCEVLLDAEKDFCFQCEGFPCEKVDFHPDLLRRWKERNQEMREVGVEEYYSDSRDIPRYQ